MSNFKLKLIFIIFLIVNILLISCDISHEEYIFTPTNHLDKSFSDISELSTFVNSYVKYFSEEVKEDHWQYPHDTYKLRTGDCEDFALLKMCWAYYSFGIKGQFYAVKTDRGYHAVFYYNGYFYDWEIYSYEEYFKTRSIYLILSYDEALGRCY